MKKARISAEEVRRRVLEGTESCSSISSSSNDSDDSNSDFELSDHDSIPDVEGPVRLRGILFQRTCHF